MDTGPSSAQRGGGEFKAVGDLNSSAIRGARQRRRRRCPARAATDGSRDVPLVEKDPDPDPFQRDVRRVRYWAMCTLAGRPRKAHAAVAARTLRADTGAVGGPGAA